jgi:hypothetical protein
MVQARKLGDDFLSGVIPRLVANNLLGMSLPFSFSPSLLLDPWVVL